MDNNPMQNLNQARQMIQNADALLIGAGAGMGVDSGMPDFRGSEGLWRAYPPLHGIHFEELANPELFEFNPRLAWGFYGHRLMMYRSKNPHQGYQILLDLIHKKSVPSFVFTSNVDGHFLRAGFDPMQILECHGSIHHLQCTAGCSQAIWPADEVEVVVDETTFLAQGDLPKCPKCGALARPNILMFGDWDWLDRRTSLQRNRFEEWRSSIHDKNIVAIEIGAGTAISTVRSACERFPRVRINPREFAVYKSSDVGLGMGALAGLMALSEESSPKENSQSPISSSLMGRFKNLEIEDNNQELLKNKDAKYA